MTNLEEVQKLMAKIAAQCIGTGTFDTAVYLRYKRDIAQASSVMALGRIVKSMMEEVLC